MKKIFAFLLISVLTLAFAQTTVSVSEFVRLNEGFSTLTAALEVTGLDVTLQGAGPFTLFAPTDAAFAALPAGRRDALLGNPQALRALLNRLIVPEKLSASDLLERGQVKTVEGSSLSVSTRGDGIDLGGAAVVGSDVGAGGSILVGNGVIQVIDELPTSLR